MIDLTDFIDIEEQVKITFTDATYLICKIDNVDDEEESGIGEMGLSVFTPDGNYVEIGQSEIKSIEVL